MPDSTPFPARPTPAAVAGATGLSEPAVRAFVRDEHRTPLGGALDAYEELLADSGLGGDEPPIARPR